MILTSWSEDSNRYNRIHRLLFLYFRTKKEQLIIDLDIDIEKIQYNTHFTPTIFDSYFKLDY